MPNRAESPPSAVWAAREAAKAASSASHAAYVAAGAVESAAHAAAHALEALEETAADPSARLSNAVASSDSEREEFLDSLTDNRRKQRREWRKESQRRHDASILNHDKYCADNLLRQESANLMYQDFISSVKSLLKSFGQDDFDEDWKIECLSIKDLKSLTPPVGAIRTPPPEPPELPPTNDATPER